MAKWIKNADTIDHTWVGQLIPFGTYYEVQVGEEALWANDSTLLSDIGSGDAVVAKDDSGTLDLPDVSTAIDYLKDLLPTSVEVATPVQTSGIREGIGMRARLVGVICQAVTKTTTENLDWQVPQLSFAGVEKKSYFNGLQYYVANGTPGDSCKFQVVDKDGAGVGLGLYPQAYYDAYKDGSDVLIVEEFGDGWFLVPDSVQDIMLYKARMYPGLYIRVIFTSAAGATVDPMPLFNIYRHLDALS